MNFETPLYSFEGATSFIMRGEDYPLDDAG